MRFRIFLSILIYGIILGCNADKKVNTSIQSATLACTTLETGQYALYVTINDSKTKVASLEDCQSMENPLEIIDPQSNAPVEVSRIKGIHNGETIFYSLLANDVMAFVYASSKDKKEIMLTYENGKIKRGE